MHLRRLWLQDFRNYHRLDISLPAATTAVVGRNGEGKTNLLEAVGFVAGASLRGSSTDTLIRAGADEAIVRADAVRGNRDLLVEARLQRRGRSTFQLNRQPLRRQSDLLDGVAVTVFSPDDLVLVKGGPGERRRWIDEAVVALDVRNASVRTDLERIVRQRNALLRGCRGRLDEAAEITLSVWDDRLSATGTAWADMRRGALAALAPQVALAYRDLAGAPLEVGATYLAEWAAMGLAAALAASRGDDLRRGVTTVGPHRDDIGFALDGLPARTHASQGEQRCLALALRLAVHRAVGDASGEHPILLLDDVLSELDAERARALLTHLPPGQTLVSTAGRLPAATDPALVVEVSGGSVRPIAGSDWEQRS